MNDGHYIRENMYDTHDDHRRHSHRYAPPPARPASGGGPLTYILVAMLSVAFGAGCIFAGMHFMRYMNRLDRIEQNAQENVRELIEMQRESFASLSPKEISSRKKSARSPDRDYIPEREYRDAPTANAQPQIYFMMGGQTAPAAYPGVPPMYQAPQLPAFMQPNTQTEMNQYMMARYQQEFSEYMRQRTMAAPQMMAHPVQPLAAPMQPGLPYSAPAFQQQDVWSVPGFSTTPAALRREYISSAISVPEKMTMELKRRYSSKPEVEDWLRDETAANREILGVDDDEPEAGDVDPQMDMILRGLAESTFADKQYERTARVYAELASRSVSLSVPELMRWSKACELAGDIDAALRILNLILKIDTENPAVLKEAAQIAVANDKFAVGAEYYQRLMKAEPNEREWRKMRAKTLTWAGRGREAVNLMRELHNEDPEDWELNLMLADLLLSVDEYADAVPVLDLLIDHSPDDDSLIERKMNALMALQKFKEAAEINAVLVKRHPDNLELVLKLAVNLVAADEFVAAIEPFEIYLAEKPDDEEVRKQFAEDLMAAQRFSQAAVEYKKLLPYDTAEQEIRKKLANAHMAAKEYRGAAEVYGQLVRMFPKDREMNVGYVVALRLSGQIDGALSAAKNYLRINPYDHKILTEAASMAMEKKQVKVAMGYYLTAVQLMPNDYESRIALGNGYIWDQKYEQAESQFRQALCHCASNYMARRGLARSLYYQRKYKESFSIYRKMSWENPGTPICLEYKFRDAMSNRQEVLASKVLVELIAADPEDITWKSDRYQSLLRQHRFPEARAQARVIMAEDPNHKPTLRSMYAMRRYLTTWPVTLRAGMLKKTSKTTENETHDRRARLTYTYFGLRGEKSISPYWRAYAEADREHWKMREDDVDNAVSYKFKMGAFAEGNPNIRFSGDLGYRWFIGSSKNVKGEQRDINDQWLYNLRGEFIELNGMPLNIGVFSGRREHYDNYNNVYDNLYAYDFGIDAHYAHRKWDFNLDLVGSTLTDTNSRFYAHADAKYRLFESPCMLLTVGANVEYESYEQQMDTYYSPKDMYKYGIDIDGRYYFCRIPESWGTTQSTIDYGISFYRDRFSSNGMKFYLGVSHDYSKRLTAFARVDFTRESFYSEMKLLAGLTYKFGGCE